MVLDRQRRSPRLLSCDGLDAEHHCAGFCHRAAQRAALWVFACFPRLMGRLLRRRSPSPPQHFWGLASTRLGSE